MVNSFALKERRIGFGPLAVISLCLLPLFLATQSAGPQGLCTQAGHSSPQDRTARGRSRPADTQKLSGTDWVSARSVKAMRQARARLWWPRQDWEHGDQGLVAQLSGGGPRNGEKLTFDSPTFRTWTKAHCTSIAEPKLLNFCSGFISIPIPIATLKSAIYNSGNIEISLYSSWQPPNWLKGTVSREFCFN